MAVERVTLLTEPPIFSIPAELAKSIQAQHPEMCRKRKEFERGLPGLNSLPLPWKPGWRNLLLGRPMGGNRFAGDSLGDSLGRVVQQLPYYIPPVVFANIMNLVFFVLVLGVVEAVPALISLIIGSIQHPEGLASFKKQVLVAAGGSGAAGEAPDRDNQVRRTLQGPCRLCILTTSSLCRRAWESWTMPWVLWRTWACPRIQGRLMVIQWQGPL